MRARARARGVSILKDTTRSYLAESLAALELLGDAHGIAIKQLGQERAERGAFDQGESATVEVLDELHGVLLLCRSPLPPMHDRPS